MARRIKKRNILYCIIIISFILGVFIEQRIVTTGRNRNIASVTSEWQEKGKPVVVKQITRRKVNTYVKITAVSVGDGYYQAYVPRIIQEKLQVGQLIFLNNNDRDPIGQVVSVSEDIDVDTGMFLATCKLDIERLKNNPEVIVYVNTKVLENVICLPREIINFDNNGDFVWKVKDNRAEKSPIVISERDGYGAVIKQGLKEGDLVVFEGYTQLFEGDKVNILEDNLSGDLE